MRKSKEKEKSKEMEEIFNQLTENNQEVINMVAKGMKIAQENEKHKPRID